MNEEYNSAKKEFSDMLFTRKADYLGFKGNYNISYGAPMLAAMYALRCGLFKPGLEVLEKCYPEKSREAREKIKADLAQNINKKALDEIFGMNNARISFSASQLN